MRTMFYNPNSRFANRELQIPIFQIGIWNMVDEYKVSKLRKSILYELFPTIITTGFAGGY
jgi:hypothetical protein